MVRRMKKLGLAAVLFCVLCGTTVGAQDVGMDGLNPKTAKAIRPIVKTANKHFTRMPQVQLTSRLVDLCNGDGETNTLVRYCTALNTIYVAADLTERLPPEGAAYVLAHAYGHAVQVRHGIADIALAKITTDRPREAELRGLVTMQVECIAGVLVGRALPNGRGKPSDWFPTEPFTGSHWGRSPMRNGPKVAIGTAMRDEWFSKGRASRDFASCAAGEMGAELILRAER